MGLTEIPGYNNIGHFIDHKISEQVPNSIIIAAVKRCMAENIINNVWDPILPTTELKLECTVSQMQLGLLKVN